MVVQAALMMPHEILVVENPEVHLHPSLQLQVTEFLMKQAKVGRCILVETHSDLVVRRVIRGILKKELSQAEVQIGFTDISSSSVDCQYSTLRELQINDYGQIDDWPTGFLSDDLDESQRLLDVMYGAPPAEPVDDEDE